MTTEGSTARRVAATVLVRLCVVALLGLSSVLTARGLNPSGRGTYGLVLAVAWIAAALGHLSIEQANVLRWQRGDDRRAIASTSVTLGLAGGIAAAVVGWFAVDAFAHDSFSASDRRLIALVLPAVPLYILGGYLVGLHVLDDRLRRVNVARLVAAASQLAALSVLWLTDELTVATAVATWVATLAALPVVLLVPGLSIRLRHVSRRLASSLLRTGLKYHVGMAALFLLRRVDIVILSAYVSRREVGLYAVAVVLAELLFVPSESIAQAVLPRQVRGSLEDAAVYSARVVRVNTFVALTAAAGLAAVSPLLIRVAYGAEYTDSVVLLAALLPGVVAVGFTRPITALLVRLDRPFVVSTICVASLAFNVALNLALIPTLGAVGASIASSLAYLLQAGAYTAWVLRSTPLTLPDLWPRREDLRVFATLLRRSSVETPATP